MIQNNNMVVAYFPIIIFAFFAKKCDNYFKSLGFYSKQQYAVRALYCLVAAILTIPDIIALFMDFEISFKNKNSSHSSVILLISYELYYIIDYINGRIDPIAFPSHLLTIILLWLSHITTQQGGLYSIYICLVVCIPDAISSLLLFVWAELEWLDIVQLCYYIERVNNDYRIIVGTIYVSLLTTCTFWILPSPTIWNVVFAIIHIGDILVSPWYYFKEPYEGCLRLLSNSSN